MRTVLVVVALLAAVPALAQEGEPFMMSTSPKCNRPALEGLVSVDLATGATSRGILYCVSDEELVLLRDGALERSKLTDVVKIVRPPDPTWDGAVIGAAIGMLTSVWWADAGILFRQTVSFAMIGYTADALHGRTRTLWVAPKTRRPTLNMTLRW